MAETTGDRAAAIDLLVLRFGMAQSWFVTLVGLRAVDGSDPHSEVRIRLHRRAVVTAARAFEQDQPREANGMSA
jgi:hypothetical protein